MILNELFRYLTFFFFFEDFQNDLGIFPLGKGFPYDKNYTPAKIVCHLKTVSLLKVHVHILNWALDQTLGQNQLMHSHSFSHSFSLHLSPIYSYCCLG